jgi:hypothetical protein
MLTKNEDQQAVQRCIRTGAHLSQKKNEMVLEKIVASPEDWGV